MAGNASHHRAGSADGGSERRAVNGSGSRFSPPDAQQESSRGEINGDRPLTIGEVAQQYGITLRTLRFYEAKRLITPYRHGATRLYRSSDRKRLSVILTGRRLGFTLAEIKHLLNRPHDGGGLQLTREQCVKQIKMLEQQKRSIETAITELRQIHTSFYRRLLEDAGDQSH
jgi:DNA-binding transcriptional MerR regulator